MKTASKSKSGSKSHSIILPKDPNDGVYTYCHSERTFSLTFDDGPGALTSEILDILLANNIKATFFVIGSNVTGREHLLMRAYNEGHTIAAHSWSHRDYTTMTKAEMIADLRKTKQAIKNCIGHRPRYFRPPFGAYNELVVKTVTDAGYKFVHWNLDSEDWKLAGSSTDVLVAHFKNQIKDADHATSSWIALFHDQYHVTAEALQKIIDYVKSKHYTFITMDECCPA